jgi:perosamine synthetase
VVFGPETGLTTDGVIAAMAEKGIPLRPFFYPLSSLPAYAANTSGGPEKHPTAYALGQRGVHLPCALNLSDDQIHFISQELSTLVMADVRI